MSQPDYLQPFADCLTQSSQWLSAQAEAGEKHIGYFCTYTPVELIHACGFVPIRVMGEPGVVEQAYSLVPDFICPFMKCALEKALNGGFKYLKGVVQGYTCDVSCGMANIWKENIPGELYHTFPLPYTVAPATRDYLHKEFQAFIHKAEQAGGEFRLERLQSSLDMYAAIRRSLLSLYQSGEDGAPALNARERHIVAQAGYVAPPDLFLGMLEALASQKPFNSRESQAGIPVLISGSLVESVGVFDAMEKAGARIVADDLCSGYRNLLPVDGSGSGPMERLIDRYVNRFPCPSRCRAEDRFPLLMDRIEQTGARGVIFLIQKFCTPHLADIPELTRLLKAAGIPVLVVEMDESWRMGGQLQTRLEGFVEMIDGMYGTNHGKI
ncbi:2-hydroxyglutaryl-CoA dehydratase D-component [Desulfatibacillum aliphaticivorans]|uniref:2-hydroxyglutaryl-CoA dehydratase D-component n=1 Tax=Desulfatibacillum aliphaticivorans TaxID=218208 RepID=B8FKU2_DESAL|nr:2-hydroxyacyl-CoA dehydratase family protein [Desulfatibacillum aliphaticivorans]ACL04464.1 2-hydroxyglutaryl-CoA dehydratase D-component [Desulfatibacillum aliphaticivorans]